jgi:peptidoglycan/LPS O-acetylase OafA/YrhL
VPKPVEGTSPYLPGLDGIRAIAVLAVIAYHLNFGWASGGLLGVQVFFVLSGYLITDLLVAEYGRHRGIGLKTFWIRRARRLLPALFVMLFVTVGWATLFQRTQLAELRSDLVPGIFYVSNWWFIFHHVSYFAQFGPPSPLGHLWSLAIEEQFYLVWPLLLLAGFRWLHTRRALITATLIAAAASALEMAILYSPSANPNRIYEGTDTRAFALLIGAALAMWLPRARPIGPVTTNARNILNGVGIASLIGIFAMFSLVEDNQPFLYEGGLLLLALLTAILIAITVHPGAQLRTILGVEPLRWVGERSYGIYLWHYPVIVLTTPVGAPPNVPRAILQFAATLIIAALSWRYIEQPIRHGALRRFWQGIRERGLTRPHLEPLGWIVVGAVGFNALLCTLGLVGIVSAEADPATQVTQIVPTRHVRTTTTTTEKLGPVASTTTLPPPAGQGVTAIGDSVMIDASPYLKQSLPAIEIDAAVGQQLYQVQQVVSQLKSEGVVGNRLILELGTNGPYSADQLRTLINSFGPMRKIVLVNTRVPRPWQNQVNATIATVARSYPNATVVNWYADSAAFPQYFYPDGVHLDPTGAAYYASLLIHALQAPIMVVHHGSPPHRARTSQKNTQTQKNTQAKG